MQTPVNVRNCLAFAIPLLALAACASSSRTYAPDGRVAYSLNCSGMARSWGDCYAKAGDLCGAAGYDVMTRDADRGALITGGMAGTVQSRTMVIACKKPSP